MIEGLTEDDKKRVIKRNEDDIHHAMEKISITLVYIYLHPLSFDFLEAIRKIITKKKLKMLLFNQCNLKENHFNQILAEKEEVRYLFSKVWAKVFAFFFNPYIYIRSTKLGFRQNRFYPIYLHKKLHHHMLSLSGDKFGIFMQKKCAG